MTHTEPTEAELAEMSVEELEAYAATFDGEPEVGEAEPIETRPQHRLDATISVRFSGAELDELRRRASEAGMKVTAYIRAVVLQHAHADVVDLTALRSQVQVIIKDVGELERRLA